jgi:hypothetical protein
MIQYFIFWPFWQRWRKIVFSRISRFDISIQPPSAPSGHKALRDQEQQLAQQAERNYARFVDRWKTFHRRAALDEPCPATSRPLGTPLPSHGAADRPKVRSTD